MPSLSLGAGEYDDDDIARDLMWRQNNGGQQGESTWTPADYAAAPSASSQSAAMRDGRLAGEGRLASAYSSDSK